MKILTLLSMLSVCLGCGHDTSRTAMPSGETGGEARDVSQREQSIVWPAALDDTSRTLLLQRYNSQSETVMAVWSAASATEIAVVIRSEGPARTLRIEVWALPLSLESAPLSQSQPAPGEAELELVAYGHFEGFSNPAILVLARTEDETAYPAFFVRQADLYIVEQLQSRFGARIGGAQTAQQIRILRRRKAVCAFSIPSNETQGDQSLWFSGEAELLAERVTMPECR